MPDDLPFGAPRVRIPVHAVAALLIPADDALHALAAAAFMRMLRAMAFAKASHNRRAHACLSPSHPPHRNGGE